MYFELTIRPRISETDMMGHINNVTPAIWLEEGRTYFFRDCLQGAASYPMPLMVRHLEVDYIDQLYFESEAKLLTGLKRIGNSSITLYQEIWQDGRLAVKGTTTIVHIDSESQRPAAVPDEVRARFAPYLQGNASDQQTS